MYVMPMKWAGAIQGDGFVMQAELLTSDTSRPAVEDPTYVDENTVVMPYDASRLPRMRDWLDSSGQSPLVAFLIDLDSDDHAQRMSFKFTNKGDAAIFKTFFG